MKTKLNNLFLSFLSVFLVIVGSEFFLKIFFPLKFAGYSDNYEYHNSLGTVIKKGYYSNVSDYKREIFINKLGTVNPQNDFKKYKNIAFALGDSYTQGLGGSLSTSYPAHLDLIINIDKGEYTPKLGVVNLGTSAYGGLQNIENYHIHKAKIGIPDYVLYFGCDNDYMDDLRFTNGVSHRRLVDGSPYFGKLVRPLQYLSRSEIIKRLKYARRSYLDSQLPEVNDNTKNNNKCESNAEKSLYVLEELLRLSKKDNFTLILSWVSSTSQDSNCSSYSWAKNWARKNDVKFADYINSINSTKSYWPNMPYSYDHSGGHFRNWVNYLIAKSFSKQLIND